MLMFINKLTDIVYVMCMLLSTLLLLLLMCKWPLFSAGYCTVNLVLQPSQYCSHLPIKVTLTLFCECDLNCQMTSNSVTCQFRSF